MNMDRIGMWLISMSTCSALTDFQHELLAVRTEQQRH
jgi:hypothetical protein